MAHQRMSQYTSQGRRADDSHTGPGERVREVYGRAQEMMGEHLAYSALACFGIGLGVGAAITLLLAPEKQKKEQAWYADYLPDDNFTHDLSKHVREAVSRMLPDAVARYLKRR